MTEQQWIKANVKAGEKYVGVLPGINGGKDQRIVLLAADVDGANYAAAVAATPVGGSLPTRQEQSFLYAQMKEEFEPEFHWSSEVDATYKDLVWAQDFDNGYQFAHNEAHLFRARYIRREDV